MSTPARAQPAREAKSGDSTPRAAASTASFHEAVSHAHGAACSAPQQRCAGQTHSAHQRTLTAGRDGKAPEAEAWAADANTGSGFCGADASLWRRVVLLPPQPSVSPAAGGGTEGASPSGNASTATAAAPVVYFYNRTTRQTTWELPAGVAAAAVKTVLRFGGGAATPGRNATRATDATSGGAEAGAEGAALRAAGDNAQHHSSSGAGVRTMCGGDSSSSGGHAHTPLRSPGQSLAGASPGSARKPSTPAEGQWSVGGCDTPVAERSSASASPAPRQLRHPPHMAAGTGPERPRAAAPSAQAAAAPAIAAPGEGLLLDGYDAALADGHNRNNDSYPAGLACAAIDPPGSAPRASAYASEGDHHQQMPHAAASADCSVTAVDATGSVDLGSHSHVGSGPQGWPEADLRRPCPTCSRSFAPGRLQRHAAACAAAVHSAARRRAAFGPWDSHSARLRGKADLLSLTYTSAAIPPCGRCGRRFPVASDAHEHALLCGHAAAGGGGGSGTPAQRRRSSLTLLHRSGTPSSRPHCDRLVAAAPPAVPSQTGSRGSISAATGAAAGAGPGAAAPASAAAPVVARRLDFAGEHAPDLAHGSQHGSTPDRSLSDGRRSTAGGGASLPAAADGFHAASAATPADAPGMVAAFDAAVASAVQRHLRLLHAHRKNRRLRSQAQGPAAAPAGQGEGLSFLSLLDATATASMPAEQSETVAIEEGPAVPREGGVRAAAQQEPPSTPERPGANAGLHDCSSSPIRSSTAASPSPAHPPSSPSSGSGDVTATADGSELLSDTADADVTAPANEAAARTEVGAGACMPSAEAIAEAAPVACTSCGFRCAGAAALCRHLVQCSAWRTGGEHGAAQAQLLTAPHPTSPEQPTADAAGDASQPSPAPVFDAPEAAEHAPHGPAALTPAAADADASFASLEGSSELLQMTDVSALPAACDDSLLPAVAPATAPRTTATPSTRERMRSVAAAASAVRCGAGSHIPLPRRLLYQFEEASSGDLSVRSGLPHRAASSPAGAGSSRTIGQRFAHSSGDSSLASASGPGSDTDSTHLARRVLEFSPPRPHAHSEPSNDPSADLSQGPQGARGRQRQAAEADISQKQRRGSTSQWHSSSERRSADDSLAHDSSALSWGVASPLGAGPVPVPSAAHASHATHPSAPGDAPLPARGSTLPCPFCGTQQPRDALWMHLGDCGLDGFAAWVSPTAAAATKAAQAASMHRSTQRRPAAVVQSAAVPLSPVAVSHSSSTRKRVGDRQGGGSGSARRLAPRAAPTAAAPARPAGPLGSGPLGRSPATSASPAVASRLDASTAGQSAATPNLSRSAPLVDAVGTGARGGQGTGAASFLALSPASTVVGTTSGIGSGAASCTDSSDGFTPLETTGKPLRRFDSERVQPQSTTQAGEGTPPQPRARNASGPRSRAHKPSPVPAGSSLAIGYSPPGTALASEADHAPDTSSDLLSRLQRVLSAARSKLTAGSNDAAALSGGSGETATLDATAGAAPWPTASLTAVPPSGFDSDWDVLAALAGGSFASAESSVLGGGSFGAGSRQPATGRHGYSPAAETLAATVARALRLQAR